MELPVYKTEKAISLRNENYHYYLLEKIKKAKYRIYATSFIINSLIKNDVELKIRNLIKVLAYAKWQNVDVKIMFGNSQNSTISTANETTAHYMKELGLSVKRYESSYRKSLHSKYVIIDDDLIMIGSHNWSEGAFSKHNEYSIAVYSKELNTILNDEFHKLWNNAKELEALP
jgi:phosphatidylserine/phosphatidylglycerophosphate/cardiolipin synthase-like enzyme